jgi:hypothetical protein
MRLVVSTSFVLLAAACTNSNDSAARWQKSLAQTDQKIAVVPAGSTCAGLGLGGQQLTLTTPVDGDYAIDAHNKLTFRYYDETNTIFYFTQSTIRMTGVIVTIGDRALMWEMPGGADGWPSLHGPPEPETDEIYSPDQVAFCYDYELYVQPSPYANHAQRATWMITKTGRTDQLVLAEGQTETVDYNVTVRSGQPTGAGQYIDGPVFVQNKSPHTVIVGAVRTMVGSLAATITCPTSPPFTMAPFTTMECAFKADVPDTTDRNVVGSATVSDNLKVTTIEVMASFAAHNTGTTTFDRCVDITDEAAPYNDHYLGTVCTEDGEQTMTFSAELGPFACGAFTVTNAAKYTGLDTGATASASWTINGSVRCNPGCTLSAFYWMMHSQLGWRTYNTTWNAVGAQGERTAFFRSGLNYIQAMLVPALGNPYFTLARAYAATKLNKLNGASFSPQATTAFNDATALLTANTPLQVMLNLSLRRQAVKAAAALRDYNQGRTGPGRCTCKAALDSDD